MVQSVQAKGKYRQAILATAGILAFFGSSIAAYAQSVVVQGNKRVETETIRSYVTDQSPVCSPMSKSAAAATRR